MARILISGASGFIGSHLSASLVADGHSVTKLVRGSRADGVRWDPESGSVDRDALARERPDAVVNLAGETIGQRWNAERKRRIRDSRVNGTSALARALASLETKPRVLVSGSAVGYYGANRGDELLDENSAPGADFLADTARAWENATGPAQAAGIRTVRIRTGLVLGASGGALARMLLPFRLGIGGRIGDGSNWMSWITVDDMVRVIRTCIESPSLDGAINATTPEPVRGSEFTRALGRVLHRPTPFPVPAFALRSIFGEMADATLLASQRVIPKRLAGAGFDFRHPRLDDALKAALTQ